MAKAIKDAPKEMPWDDAIRKVLSDAGGPLHYGEISTRIIEQKLRTKVGVTPDSSVISTIGTSIKSGYSPYIKIEKGIYALKEVINSPANLEKSKEESTAGAVETGALRSFGMFWRRDLVQWEGIPKILGRQKVGAEPVNFSNQIGIYLLHDRERTLYVGRATKDSLFVRLKAHTTDRLGGRWDRFSWFGMKDVGEKAELIDHSANWTQSDVVDTMEALLIESLEPPLNRKRGDNFSGSEYLQVAGPDLEKKTQQEWLDEIKTKLSPKQ